MANTYKFCSEWHSYPPALRQFNNHRYDIELLHNSGIRFIRVYKPFLGYWTFEYELVK